MARLLVVSPVSDTYSFAMVDFTPDSLPTDLLAGATLRGSEYGWTPESFANVVAMAPDQGCACIGGQFQFRLPDATCEMYWLSADSAERRNGESWSEYSRRSCNEVLGKFNRLLQSTDFRAEASNFDFLRLQLDAGFDPIPALVFVAYFVNEQAVSE